MKVYNIVLILTVMVIGALSFSSCKKDEAANGGQKVQPVNITVETLKLSPMVDGVEIAGTVKAIEDVMMSPEEGGVVKEWVKKKGDHVKKGELIVTLKDEVMKASCDAAEAQYKMAQLNVEKQKSVYEQQGISELQYKNMEFGRDAAKANFDLMQARLERTQLRSPIDGVVDNTMPNEGEMAPPGVPIARVVNISSLKIQAEVPELYSGMIAVGTPAAVTFDAVPGETVNAKVLFVGSTVSQANRTLMVEILLSNPKGKIKPEMVAKVTLVRRKKSDAILVSDNIVQLVDRDRYVVYVEKNGIAEERRVTIGGRQGNFVEVTNGLNAGERLIVSGYQKLVNGSPVVITK
jgi:membrane fusion protein, multidrug efflux system